VCVLRSTLNVPYRGGGKESCGFGSRKKKKEGGDEPLATLRRRHARREKEKGFPIWGEGERGGGKCGVPIIKLVYTEKGERF